MRNIKILFISLLATLILVGCSNFTDALSGIDSRAQKAASALTPEALKDRSIQLEYKNEYFTIDELFTSILRDVTWEYEKNDDSHILSINGTWKNGLFEDYDFTEEMTIDLQVDGKVTAKLEIVNDFILVEKTKVKMTVNEKIIVDETGETAQNSLYEAYFLQ